MRWVPHAHFVHCASGSTGHCVPLIDFKSKLEKVIFISLEERVTLVDAIKEHGCHLYDVEMHIHELAPLHMVRLPI